LNSLVSNKSMTGRSGHLSPALPTDKIMARLAN
jgi:hypothetical protein